MEIGEMEERRRRKEKVLKRVMVARTRGDE
jgi:hypothetical protein